MPLSPQQVVEQHAAAVTAGDIVRIMADYADGAILVAPERTHAGKMAVQAFFERTLASYPNLTTTVESFTVQGDTVLVSWSGEADTATITEAVDSFVIQDGTILRQTVWFKAVSKNG